MTLSEHYWRARIDTRGQHPLRHTLDEFAYAHPALPGVTNVSQALTKIMAVLYPQAKADVATVGDLPSVGNALDDYRVVLDDGDGNAAGYRWEQREGDAAAKWYKVADWDWSADEIISGMYNKTLYHYVHKWGYNDIDEDGVELTAGLAGQHVYGGATANTHLTLHANAGDGVGAQTGFIQFDDHVRPTVDAVYTLGTVSQRFLEIWVDEVLVGDTVYYDGGIDSPGPDFDFNDLDLVTTGTVSCSHILFGDGLVGTPAISFSADPDLGFYRIGDDEMGVAAVGVRVATFGDGYFDLVQGSAAEPSLRWAGDDNTGLYSPGADQLGLSTAGVARILVGAAGGVTVNTDDLVVDAGNDRIGFGVASPLVDMHLLRSGPAVLRLEARHGTASNAATLQLYRSGLALANLATSDDLGVIDAYGRVGAAWVALAGYKTLYRGDGTGSFADHIWSTANGGAPAERMRLRYDGNLGIGINDPLYPLQVVGAVGIGDLVIENNVITATNPNGSIGFQPDGTGVVVANSPWMPAVDATYNLGGIGSTWANLYVSGSISAGGEEMLVSDLITLRNINVDAEEGMALFNVGGLWVASYPDTEVDHGALSGLTDDDHPQYANGGGRAGGQFLYGGVDAGDHLLLGSTMDPTKGHIIAESVLRPDDDDTYDLGTVDQRWQDLYLAGQLIGARVENYTTAGRPAASASSIGRLYYDTTEQDIYVDRGGTWKKISIEKYVFQDAVNWDGTETTATYDVSAEISDARECVWVFKNNSDDFKQIGCDITMTETHVTVTVDLELDAGTYTLVGVG